MLILLSYGVSRWAAAKRVASDISYRRSCGLIRVQARAIRGRGLCKQQNCAPLRKSPLIFWCRTKCEHTNGMAKADRHGRALAQVYVVRGRRAPVAARRELVGKGLARVYSFPDNHACVDDLLARDAEARAKGAGLWALGLIACSMPAMWSGSGGYRSYPARRRRGG